MSKIRSRRKFFEIMIDESTNISIPGHPIVFSSINNGLPICVYSRLLHIEVEKKMHVYIFLNFHNEYEGIRIRL